MKRIILLTCLLLASVTFGCQGVGPAGTPGSGSSFKGGTEDGNSPTDGDFFGGTEAGNPPTGEHGGTEAGNPPTGNHGGGICHDCPVDPPLPGHCGDEGVTWDAETNQPCPEDTQDAAKKPGIHLKPEMA